MSIIYTWSGIPVSLEQPTPDMIDPIDIARALSRICRFGGHSRHFYSVAQHCVLASQHVGPQHRLAALLHDAAEAYVGDMISPLKAHLPDYMAIEDRFRVAIADRFGLCANLTACVEHVDRVLLATEKRDLLSVEASWPCLEGVAPLPMQIEPWSMDDAYARWIKRFESLQDMAWINSSSDAGGPLS